MTTSKDAQPMITLVWFVGMKLQTFRTSNEQYISSFPVNIRNVLKWFKRLQNIFKT